MSSAFFVAVKSGDSDTIKASLAEDPSLLVYRGAGTPDANIGNSAVHWAAAKGHPNVLALLLEAKGDPHARNNGDSTPLSTAVMAGSVECISLLLAARADPLLADEFGDSPLSLAGRSKRDDLVALLSGGGGAAADGRAAGAAAPVPPPTAGATECKQKGNAAFARKEYDEAIEWYRQALSAVQLTLEGGPGVAPAAAGEAKEAMETAAALFSNRSACYAALEMFGPALDDAQRAVQLRPQWAKAHSRVGAARHGQKELQLALDAYQQAAQLEPASEAAQAQLRQIRLAIRNERLEKLIDKGAFNPQNDGGGDGSGGGGSGGGGSGGGDGDGGGGGGGGGDGAKPLKPSTTVKPAKTREQIAYAQSVASWMGAAKSGDTSALAALLDKEGWLLTNRSEKTAESLLGNTALHWASAFGRVEAVSWLIHQEGVEVSGRNHGGGTPLHSAASHNRVEAVEVLLEAGGDVAAKDENGDTPRDAAMRRGYRVSESRLDRGPLTVSARWPCGESGGGAVGSGNAPRPESSAAAKSAGNAAFAGTHLLGPRHAVWHYTDAILLHREETAVTPDAPPSAPVDVSDAGGAPTRAPTPAESAEAVLLSNRSAAHAKLYQYHAALDDAMRAVELRPTWGKAHGRVAAAHQGLGAMGEAEAAYRLGLRHEPSEQLQAGLDEVLGMVLRKREKEAKVAAAAAALPSCLRPA